MISGFNTKIRLNPPAQRSVGKLDQFGGGDYRYGWCINYGDQTVSIWDCSTDTVTATVTLSAGKSFSCGFYRSIDKSIWVMGSSYFDRIDLDPSSGTFCTKVESGATQFSSYNNTTYLPYPFDAIGPSNFNGGPDFTPIKYINNSTWGTRQEWVDNASRFQGAPRMGHNNYTNLQLFPLNKMIALCGGANQVQFFDILSYHRNVRQFRKYVFQRSSILPTDLAQSQCAGYVFGNFIPMMSIGSLYIMSKYSFSPLLTGTVTGSGQGSTVVFFEYCPNAKKLFVANKSGDTTIGVFSLGNKVVTSLGSFNRTAYKATGEDSTDNMMYNPVYKKLYVQAHRQAATAGTTNLIHVYDPTKSVLADMYLSSITVGAMEGTGRSGNYSLNGSGFNGNIYRESNHTI